MLRSLKPCAWLLAAALAGCATPYATPVAEGPVQEFTGVHAMLEQHGSADLVVVHGMCTRDAGWNRQAIRDLYGALGGEAGQVKAAAAAPAAAEVHVEQEQLSIRGRPVRIAAVRWSPLTVPLKQDLCYDQSDKSPICLGSDAYGRDRASANRMLKDALMNDCLADALAYQGAARAQISRGVQEALTRLAGSLGAGPIVVVTDSLGSKVTFDAVDQLLKDRTDVRRQRAGERFREQVTHIFMRANQLPILRLADSTLGAAPLAAVPPGAQPGFPADPLGSVFGPRIARSPAPLDKAAGAGGGPLVVAFTDPNDLLSYRLRPHHVGGLPLANFTVSNAPTVLGFIERPDKAHQDYDRNPEVNRIIACGWGPRRAC